MNWSSQLHKTRQHLLDHYLERLAGFVELGRDQFMHHYYAFVYIRIMQALGAYGFRGFYERKPHFLQSVPFALKNLKWLLENVELPLAVPMLLAAFKKMIESEKLQNLASSQEQIAVQPPAVKAETPAATLQNLVLRIFSFSFHQN